MLETLLSQTFRSLHSLESEKAGNISSYFPTASYNIKKKTCILSAAVLRIYMRARWPDGELTFALSSSTMKWHKEALKKYSLALYFSRGLSMVLVPTCWHTQTRIPEWFRDCRWASNVVRICRRQTDGLPAHKSLLLSGTALTERCMKPPSADTCLQSCKLSKQTISKP